MSGVGERERVTQNNVINLFVEKLGYSYLGNLKEFENTNINEKLLRLYLNKKGYDTELITLAIAELIKTAGNQSKTLYEVNKEVYTLLRYGVRKKLGSGEKHKTVRLFNSFMKKEKIEKVGTGNRIEYVLKHE